MELMGNWLLAGILLTNFVIIISLVIIVARVRKVYQDITEQVRSFFNAQDEKTPSPFAETMQIIADMFAKQFVSQAKVTLMGLESGLVRGARKVEEEAVRASNPILGALMNAFPGATKSLMKNPALLNVVGNFLNGQKSGSNGSKQNEPSFTGKLEIGGK